MVAKLLCAIINKLATADDPVRKKCFELLNLLTTRLKPIQNAHLPATKLLDTFKQSSAAIVQNTALMYLGQALERMSPIDRLDMVRYVAVISVSSRLLQAC